MLKRGGGHGSGSIYHYLPLSRAMYKCMSFFSANSPIKHYRMPPLFPKKEFENCKECGTGRFNYPIPPLGEWDLVFVWFHLRYYYYYYPIPPEGEWDLVVVWFHLRYYYYPIPPEGEWDLVFVWFHLRYYYYTRSSSSSSKGWSDFTLLLKLSQ